MKTVEIEKGDTVIIHDYDTNAEIKLENVDFLSCKTKQYFNEQQMGFVNFVKYTLASNKFTIKSDYKIEIEPEENNHAAN
jgi:hypothetical protein